MASSAGAKQRNAKALVWNRDPVPGQLENVHTDTYSRVTVRIPSASKGESLEAWLYTPASSKGKLEACPIVIMAAPFGWQKDLRMPEYAITFAEAGLAALSFDYRSFGGSDGLPRHCLQYKRQLEDCQTVLDFVHAGGLGSACVDTARVALWGMCWSGAHMLTLGSKPRNHDKVKALVVIAPYGGADASIMKNVQDRGAGMAAKLLSLGLADKVLGVVGRDPIYLPIAAPEGCPAFVTLSQKELEQCIKGAKQSMGTVRIGSWKPIVTARSVFDIQTYRPLKKVSRIRTPTLLIAGTLDETTPLHVMHKTRDTIGDRCEFLTRPYGHVEIFDMMCTREEMGPMISFLHRKLGVSVECAPSPSASPTYSDAGSASVIATSSDTMSEPHTE